jgi:Zn-dependent metalloprotease
MLKHTLIISIFAAILGFSVTGYTQELNPSVLEMVGELKQKLGAEWIVELNPQGTRIVKIEKKPNGAKKNPVIKQGKLEDIGMAFLKENARFLQLRVDLADLKVEPINTLDIDYNSDYMFDVQQTFNGLPVSSCGLSVEINPREGVTRIYNNYIPNINISTLPLLSEDDALAIAQEDTLKNHMEVPDKFGEMQPIPIKEQKNPFTERPVFELGIIIKEETEEPILVYRFNLEALKGRVNTFYILNADTGAFIDDPNPGWVQTIVRE